MCAFRPTSSFSLTIFHIHSIFIPLLDLVRFERPRSPKNREKPHTLKFNSVIKSAPAISPSQSFPYFPVSGGSIPGLLTPEGTARRRGRRAAVINCPCTRTGCPRPSRSCATRPRSCGRWCSTSLENAKAQSYSGFLRPINPLAGLEPKRAHGQNKRGCCSKWSPRSC